MKGLNSPAVFFSSAFAPRPFTTSWSFVRFAPLTVRSAVTTTLLVTGSVAQDVPGMVARSVRVCRAVFSSASVCSTILALPPALRTDSAAASSTTFITSALASAS